MRAIFELPLGKLHFLSAQPGEGGANLRQRHQARHFLLDISERRRDFRA